MKKIEYIKTYGIKEGYHKGQKVFFVVDNGNKTSLHYKNPLFAMKKAKSFITLLYKPFINFRDEAVSFKFIQK